jgi:alpha-N-dichloroacetyl-p-aminophenylserinol N-oxygenase
MSIRTRSQGPPDFERDLLAKLTARWGERVAVKQDELDLDGHFDPRLPDFPDHLVPILHLPGENTLDSEARQQILSAAWIAYNQKTSAIENEIILPAVRLMLDDSIPVRKDDIAVAALHQTIIDEHYHILMCQNAAGVTRRRRNLAGLSFNSRGWSTVRGLHHYRTNLTGTERDLVEIAYALAAETTINLLFTDLATDFNIQPMNRITVDMHRRDESGHAVVFRELAGPLYRALAVGERELFKAALLQGLVDFQAPDFAPWAAVAGAGGLDVSAEQVATITSTKPPRPRDTGPLQVLLADLDLTEDLGAALASSAC